jgi:hypothetical protein
LDDRETFAVEGMTLTAALPAHHVEWLDWDRRGRLVLLGDGRVWAAPIVSDRAGEFEQLIDLRADRPENRVAPAEATRW